MTQLTKGELTEIAKDKHIDPEQSYEELREALDITKCRWCGDEFVYGWTEKFCSDACEVQYINEYH